MLRVVRTLICEDVRTESSGLPLLEGSESPSPAGPGSMPCGSTTTCWH